MKTSKSLGHVNSVPDVVERGFEPRQLRFALVRGHYRNQINFTWAIMDEIRARLENLDEIAVLLHRVLGEAESLAGLTIPWTGMLAASYWPARSRVLRPA